MDKVANLVKVTLVDIDYGDKEEFLLWCYSIKQGKMERKKN